MRQPRSCICQAALLLSITSSLLCNAFTPAIQHNSPRIQNPLVVGQSSLHNKRQPAFTIPLWQQQQSDQSNDDGSQRHRPSLWRRVLRRPERSDTVQSDEPGLDDEHTDRTASLFGKLKRLHDPITYFVLGILAGFRWDWCFRNPVYWFAIGYTIKWYRARYVFKIPVWDRQPNWNNVITSKEQEKDLKALTCKNCGSTIFIAKTREFFFEGGTGLGGLGCFACGAKGKDNFVEDRDRIVEDVGDMDDYFEYERPLDFVSRAERRKLLKETEGDEEKANQLLLERQTGSSSSSPPPPPSNVVDAEIEEPASKEKEPETGDVADAETEEANGVKETPSADADVREPETESPVAEGQGDESGDAETSLPKATFSEDKPELKVEHAEKELEPMAKQTIEPPAAKSTPKKQTPKPKQKKTVTTSSPPSGVIDLDGLDELDMDAF